jgi:hypothetical protein
MKVSSYNLEQELMVDHNGFAGTAVHAEDKSVKGPQAT